MNQVISGIHIILHWLYSLLYLLVLILLIIASIWFWEAPFPDMLYIKIILSICILSVCLFHIVKQNFSSFCLISIATIIQIKVINFTDWFWVANDFILMYSIVFLPVHVLKYNLSKKSEVSLKIWKKSEEL